MKIGFLGSPYSGKTTTAAMLFARLKLEGVSAEYMPEYARTVIRLNRARGMELEEFDQLAIMWGQRHGEHAHTQNTSPGHVLITDGSTVNSVFYMDPDFVASHGESADIRHQASGYDLLFYCDPVFDRTSPDPNRVHDREFSEVMDSRMLMKGVLDIPNVVRLSGDPHQRLQTAYLAARKALLR